MLCEPRLLFSFRLFVETSDDVMLLRLLLLYLLSGYHTYSTLLDQLVRRAPLTTRPLPCLLRCSAVQCSKLLMSHLCM